MSYSFAALAPGYTHLLATMQITNPGLVNATAVKLLKYIDEGYYKDVSDEDGIPQIWMATSFERESSSNFHTSPAQGDPLWIRSIHVPRGLGPYIDHNDTNHDHWVKAWSKAAKDAYRIDHLDKVGKDNWSWERACYEGELFNGFGYRQFGINSPYLFACSNHYSYGKYTGDGQFSRTAHDTQIGIIPVMFRMAEIRPSLTLPIAFPSSTTAPMPAVTPPAAPVLPDAKALQVALNKLGTTPQLDVDGNYGRMTARAVRTFQQSHGLDVDGIAGLNTWLAINKALRDKTATNTPPSPPGLPNATKETLIPATKGKQTNIWDWLRSQF